MAKRKRETFPSEKAESMDSKEIGKWLEEREKKFQREYLTDLNGTQAAIRAGYSAGKNNASAAVTASRLLRCEIGRAYRNAILRENVEDCSITKESILLKLMEIYRRCMAAIPVMEWDETEKVWVESGEWRFDARGAAKALEQISKLMGFDAPQKVNLGGEGLEDFLAKLGGGRRF